MRGLTELHIASVVGDVSKMQQLLEGGVDDINRATCDGQTPLFFACWIGDAASVRVLLDHGADVDHNWNKDMSPLFIACARGHEACVRLLVEHGADVNKGNGYGWTPLKIACSNGFEAVAQLLLEAGAHANHAEDKGATALMVASATGNEACVRLLLKRGAQLNARDENGKTACDRATSRRRTACQILLVEHGAQVRSVNFGDAAQSVEVAVAVGGNQHITEARFDSMPSEELRAIMRRSPSLEKICSSDELVLWDDDALLVCPAVQCGDLVREHAMDGDWEVKCVLGRYAELEGREGTVPIAHLIFAGPAHVAWQEVSAAEARGQSNVITRVLCRRGFISTHVRSLVTSFLAI